MANVPSLQAAAQNPTYIQVGPASLWVNVTPPADGQPLLVSGQLSGVNDQRLYGPLPYTISGTFVGSTIGESTMSYTATFVDILVENNTAIVEKVLNTEAARVDFSLAELTAETAQATAFPGSYWNQPVATLTSTADPLQAGQQRHTLTFGGLRLVDPQCVAFISANRRISVAASGTGVYSYVFCGYKAVSTEGFTVPFSRGRESVYRCSFQFLGDPSRTVGKQMAEWTCRMPF